MITFFVTLALGCGIPTKTNLTDLPWNRMDEHSFKSAKVRCKAHYPEFPCLRQFIKVRYNTYYAVCAKEKA